MRLPLPRHQLLAQQLGRVFLHQDLRLEIESGGKAEVLVARAREAIDAAVLAAAIRIDARVEADVGAVVVAMIVRVGSRRKSVRGSGAGSSSLAASSSSTYSSFSNRFCGFQLAPRPLIASRLGSEIVIASEAIKEVKKIYGGVEKLRIVALPR